MDISIGCFTILGIFGKNIIVNNRRELAHRRVNTQRHITVRDLFLIHFSKKFELYSLDGDENYHLETVQSRSV